MAAAAIKMPRKVQSEMTPREHLQYIRQLAEKDGRYSPDAFVFVTEAIAYTARWLQDGTIKANDVADSRGGDGEFHVSGQELLEGLRLLAMQRWGQMAKVVLERWGVNRTEDFGEIVFCMVGDETLKWQKREDDSIEDFADGYDFSTAFNVL